MRCDGLDLDSWRRQRLITTSSRHPLIRHWGKLQIHLQDGKKKLYHLPS
jgi:hypothetical protein